MAEHEHESGMTRIAGGARGEVPTFVAMPSAPGPWPGVAFCRYLELAQRVDQP